LFDIAGDLLLFALAGLVDKKDGEGKADEDEGEDDLLVMGAEDFAEVAQAGHKINDE
jgi:hypothetical protein